LGDLQPCKAGRNSPGIYAPQLISATDGLGTPTHILSSVRFSSVGFRLIIRFAPECREQPATAPPSTRARTVAGPSEPARRGRGRPRLGGPSGALVRPLPCPEPLLWPGNSPVEERHCLMATGPKGHFAALQRPEGTDEQGTPMPKVLGADDPGTALRSGPMRGVRFPAVHRCGRY
jgi:hypothetical protein